MRTRVATRLHPLMSRRPPEATSCPQHFLWTLAPMDQRGMFSMVQLGTRSFFFPLFSRRSCRGGRRRCLGRSSAAADEDDEDLPLGFSA